mmetsp:Transcript_1426/g.2367  ORF Transcript_1426/g.2367 Transcript_1426/m.2367 type:complete len:114 (+) Transcript_1426:59-400(+)
MLTPSFDPKTEIFPPNPSAMAHTSPASTFWHFHTSQSPNPSGINGRASAQLVRSHVLHRGNYVMRRESEVLSHRLSRFCVVLQLIMLVNCQLHVLNPSMRGIRPDVVIGVPPD